MKIECNGESLLIRPETLSENNLLKEVISKTEDCTAFCQLIDDNLELSWAQFVLKK